MKRLNKIVGLGNDYANVFMALVFLSIMFLVGAIVVNVINGAQITFGGW